MSLLLFVAEKEGQDTMRFISTTILTITMCVSALACTVEDGGDGELERAALVEEAQEQASLALVEHAACVAEPTAACGETEDEVAAALEHLHELREDELAFRAGIWVTCGAMVVSCSGVSCWGQDEIACACLTADNVYEINVCLEALDSNNE